MTCPTQRAYLCHMRDALAAIREYTAGGRDAFFAQILLFNGGGARTQRVRPSPHTVSNVA
jgi:hypothetical protein